MATTSSETAALQARLGRLEGYLREDANNLGLLDECVDLAFRLGKLEDARTRAERGLSLAPEDPRFLFRLANVCIAQRRLDEAESILSKLKDAGSELAVVCYNLAYVRVLKGDYTGAVALLREILGRPGCPPEAEALLMHSLHGAGQVEEALKIAHERLQSHPEDGKAMGIASLLHLDNGDLEQAGKLAARALESEPDSMAALVTHGSVALAKEKPRDARVHFERALSVNPRDGRAWSGLALSDMFALDLPRAYAGFKKAVANMPDHIGTWHALAWCQILMKDLEGAEASFNRALSINRNFGESHGGLAVVAALQKRNDAAKESAEIALRLDPSSMSGRYAQAILSGEIKDSASFRRFAEQVLQGQAAPGGGDMRGVLARMQRTINRTRLPRN
jgi:tetratricopeptide (TPR) repeat protein